LVLAFIVDSSIEKTGEKKPPGFGAPAVCIEMFGCLSARLSSAGDREPKVKKVKSDA
jgi:hypothetical protein